MNKRVIQIAAIVLSFVPIISALLLYSQMPETIPTHFALDGSPNEWGSRSSVFVLGGILCAANLLCAFFMFPTEKLLALGMINGVRNPVSARIVLLLSIVFIDVVAVVVNVIQLNTAFV